MNRLRKLWNLWNLAWRKLQEEKAENLLIQMLRVLVVFGLIPFLLMAMTVWGVAALQNLISVL